MMDSATALTRAISVKFVNFAIEEISSRDWASATFTGARHQLRFRTDGETAESEAGAFLADLTDAEFDLRGHLLIDVALVSQTRTGGPQGPIVTISLEALTMENA